MAEQKQDSSVFQSSASPESFVLDACALIAYFTDEAGADKVEQLIARAQDGEVQLFAASINVYEVYYDALRRSSLEKAEELLCDIYDLPFTFVESIDRTLMRLAAHIKITHKMSVADSFALALAKQVNARVVSNDHHEFDAVEESGELQFFWLQ